MGTKNSPDEFDCWNKALPDEPGFMLLARDRHMPKAVNDWADQRELEIRQGYGGDKEKLAAELRQLQRAREIAKEAANWRRQNMGVWKGALANKIAAEVDAGIIPFVPAHRAYTDNSSLENLAAIPYTPSMLTLEEELNEGDRLPTRVQIGIPTADLKETPAKS